MVAFWHWFVLAVVCRPAASEEPHRLRAIRSNPAKFERSIFDSFNGALDRLQRRGPWHSRLLNGPGVWRQQGDALHILLQVWRHRDDPIFLPEACETLAKLANDGNAVDELESFLPQLAYMILGLPANSLMSSVLERFVLRICESNAHWALQLSWTVFAALEDNRPGGELGGNPSDYSRAARLLQLIEQSVVYGANMLNRDAFRSSALAHNVRLWRDRVLARVQQLAEQVALTEGAATAEGALTIPPQPTRPGGGGVLGEPRSIGGLVAIPSAALETGGGDQGALYEPGGPSVTLEGTLLKRRRRDTFGVWRCCGESWARRWFVLRGSVLFYYRRRSDSRPRGAMPLGQCDISVRRSSRGEYLRLSTRFSSFVMRIRAEGPASSQLTHTWLRALGAAAGLPCSPQPGVLQPRGALVASRSPTEAVSGGGSSESTLSGGDAARAIEQEDTDRSIGDGRTAACVLPPVDILEGADVAALSTWQRCSWLYLRGVRDFVRTLARLSEGVFTPGAPGARGVRPLGAEASTRLETLLTGVTLPPLAYVPFCHSSDVLRPVVRITPKESGVFVTRARASVLLHLEVTLDTHGRKLSQLFEAVKARRESIAKDLSFLFDGLQLPSSQRADKEANAPMRLGGDAPLPAANAAEGGDLEARPTPPASSAEPPSATSAASGEAYLDSRFGEAWEAKAARVRKASPHGHRAGWALLAMISKANDDVRQEVFVMQCIALFDRIFPHSLRLRPYRILATGPSSGLIEMVTDTSSLDRLKRRPGYVSLRAHFEAAFGPPESASFKEAQRRFVCSLAAYSIVAYVLAIKDRHNGNLLLDRRGHLVHIDFGFVLGRAPGSIASLEAAVPFKLTKEMVDVLGGPEAPLFTETFVQLCTEALLAVRKHADALLGLLEVTMLSPALPCFQGAGRAPLEQLRNRLMLSVPDDELCERVRTLVTLSYDHINTRLYDGFQKMSNNIEP